MIFQINPEQQSSAVNTDVPPAPSITQQTVNTPTPPPTSPQPNKGSYNKIHILLGILVLIILMFSYIYFSNSKNPTNNNPKIQTNNTPQNLTNNNSKIQININHNISFLEISNLINKSNILLGIPNSTLFVLTYTNNASQGTNTYKFISKSYGMDFSKPIVNYSKNQNENYTLLIPAKYAHSNSPFATVVFVWQFNSSNSSKQKYLDYLKNNINIMNYFIKNKNNNSVQSNQIITLNLSNNNLYYSRPQLMINGNPANSSAFDNLINSTLLSYYKMNATLMPEFYESISPAWENVTQTEVTFGYDTYLVSVYVYGINGKYNDIYTRKIANNVLNLFQ